MGMENHVGMISTGETPDSSTRALWQSYQQSSNSKTEGNYEFGLLSHFEGKILRHGSDGSTSPPKEGVLCIFIVPQNPSLSAGIEPANLGSSGKHASHYVTEDDTGSHEQGPHQNWSRGFESCSESVVIFTQLDVILYMHGSSCFSFPAHVYSFCVVLSEVTDNKWYFITGRTYRKSRQRVCLRTLASICVTWVLYKKMAHTLRCVSFEDAAKFKFGSIFRSVGSFVFCAHVKAETTVLPVV
jgi:hypothetical protein